MVLRYVRTKLSLEDRNRFISYLRKDFPYFEITDLGTLRGYLGSFHYHIKASNFEERGVLEMTFGGSLNDKIILKIADNRSSKWVLDNLDLLEKYLLS